MSHYRKMLKDEKEKNIMPLYTIDEVTEVDAVEVVDVGLASDIDPTPVEPESDIYADELIKAALERI